MMPKQNVEEELANNNLQAKYLCLHKNRAPYFAYPMEQQYIQNEKNFLIFTRICP